MYAVNLRTKVAGYSEVLALKKIGKICAVTQVIKSVKQCYFDSWKYLGGSENEVP